MSENEKAQPLAITVRDVGKRFQIETSPAGRSIWHRIAGARGGHATLEDPTGRDVWALRHVGFEVPTGQIFGVIGRNGSGKTTLLQILARVTAPTEGEATIVGRVAALLAVGAGFHPELTGRDNVTLSGTIVGMSGDEIQERFEEIVEFAEIDRYLDEPVKHYSSGMYVRLAYSVAAFFPAEVMLVDEVLAVGDVVFKEKAQVHMKGALQDGRTVMYVGHDIDVVRELCERALVLDAGQPVFVGAAEDAVNYYVEEVVGRHTTGTSRGRAK